MPGYVIHLAIGKIYEKNNYIKDIESFEKGIIAPDLTTNKPMTHYGPYSSRPGLNRYLNEHGIKCEFDEGYFLHLVSDYLFYNKFLKTWDKSIYEDYDILNDRIVEEYNIVIPKEIEYAIHPKTGKLNILNIEDIEKFIKVIGNINYREIIKQKNIDREKEFHKTEFEI